MYMYNKHTPWMSNLCLSKPFWLQFFCHPRSSNLEGQLKTAHLERECAFLKSGCCIPTTHNLPRIFHTNPRKKTGTASLDVLEILPPQVVTVSPLPSERLKVPQKSTCSICFSCIWCTWTWATIFGRIDTNEVLRTSGMTLYKSIPPYV